MRYERKWVVSAQNYNKLLNDILNFNIGFKKSYKDRNVNSIYFDSPLFLSVKENFYGLTEKRKYRVRWYGNKNIITKPVLEIKKKNGWINQKELIKINNFDNCKINNPLNIVNLEKFINKNLKLKKKIIPLVTTHYLRKYMVSKKFNIRITLDRFLQSGEIINYRFVTNKIDLKNLIFEMKYENKYDNFVKNNLMHNYRLSKNSKFINSLYNSRYKKFL